MSQLVFIDDSGDPGFKSDSSEFFLFSAVVFRDEKVAERLAKEIDKYKRSLGWEKSVEFKFQKTNKQIIAEVLRLSLKYEYEVYAIYIDKNLAKPRPHSKSNRLYNWLLIELLKKMPINDAKLRIDGRNTKQYMRQTASMIRKELNYKQKILNNIKFVDSRMVTLIQLADLVSGSTNRSLQLDKTDNYKYLNLIRQKVKFIEKVIP